MFTITLVDITHSQVGETFPVLLSQTLVLVLIEHLPYIVLSHTYVYIHIKCMLAFRNSQTNHKYTEL